MFDNTGDSRIIDEWTFGQYQDYNTALTKLQQHWDTWITEADFSAIAAAGYEHALRIEATVSSCKLDRLNHVRLPIGYWAFDVSAGEPFIQGQLPYLTKACNWASAHGLKLIVDLHGTHTILMALYVLTGSHVGAPGSQNGYE